MHSHDGGVGDDLGVRVGHRGTQLVALRPLGALERGDEAEVVLAGAVCTAVILAPQRLVGLGGAGRSPYP